MIDLLINNKKVDLTQDVNITLNATDTDYTNPTAVKVSYSKTISIEGTQNNNQIFANLYRLDGSNMSGFDTTIRNEAIILNNGTLIDSGYITLDSVNIKNGHYTYNVTFYSLLGQFFYNLKYNNNEADEDEEKTLYDLYYGFEIGGQKLSKDEENNRVLMQWTKDYIVDSWNELFDPSKNNFNNLNTNDIRHLITAASTYSGYYDDFDNNKVMSNNPNDSIRQSYGIETSKWNTSKEYTKNWMIFEAPRDLDENEVRDLRSLYQRPAIKVKAILDAISNPENNGGFNVEWPDDCKDLSTPLGCYYNLTWLINDRFSFEDYTPKTEKVLTVSELINNTYSGVMFDGDVTTDTSLLSAPQAQVALNINIPYPDNIEPYDKFYLQHFMSNGKNLLVYTSIIEYDFYYNGVSHRYIICDKKPDNIEEWRRTYCPSLSQTYFDGAIFLETEFVRNTVMNRFTNKTELLINLPDIPKNRDFNINVRQNVFYCTSNYKYTTEWVKESDVQSYLDNGWKYVLVEYSADDVTEMLPDRKYEGGTFLFNMRKYVGEFGKEYYGLYPNTTDKDFIWKGEGMLYSNISKTDKAFLANVHTLLDNNKDGNYYSVLYDTIKSSVQNTAIDKKVLFNGSRTPLDYLLNFTKLLNLKFIYDRLGNTIRIVTNEQYYTGNIVNIEDRIDRSSNIAIRPNFYGSKVFKYQLPSKDSYLKYLYEKKSNKEFLTYMYNTNNFVLNGTNDVLSDFVFNSVSDFNQQSVYYNDVNNTVLTKGNKWNVQLFKADSTEDVEVWFNKNSKILDNNSKLCLFDNDNKTITNSINLVFLGSCIYAPFENIAVSDNLEIMYQLNGAPCYIDVRGNIMGVASLNDSKQTQLFKRPLYIPYFSPYLLDVTYINNTVGYKSLNAELSTLLVKPEFTTSKNINLSECGFIFDQFHKSGLKDYFNRENKEVTCYVKLNNHKALSDTMRDFYYFNGGVWRLNKIEDLDVIIPKLTKCTFLKVIDVSNYFKRKKMRRL